jgi:hypothetical protein
MGDTFQDSYVKNTNPSPYHLVVMQSQKMTNDALWNLWQLTQVDEDDSDFDEDRSFDYELASMLHYVSFGVYPGGYIDAYLKAGEIVVHVTSGTPQLYYQASFESGTLEVHTNTDIKNLESKEWDVTNWRIAFPVNIGNPSSRLHLSLLT